MARCWAALRDAAPSRCRSHRSGRLRGSLHANDLEVDQVVPVGRPFSKERLVFRFHDLEAALEVEINPAGDVSDAVRSHPAPFAKAAVHLGRSPWSEMLNHHVEHGSHSLLKPPT